MSSVLGSLLEDSFQCPICLNVFSDPVSTPCGHTFCKSCLSQHWDNQELCKCPLCNKRFHGGTELSTNSVMTEISNQIKRRKVETLESVATPSQVKCDMCTDLKLKASKSCLGCWASYCELHLELHQRVPSMKTHKLIEPVESPEERMCVLHEKILEFFCRDEQEFVCLMCMETDHSGDEVVTVEEEVTRQKENIDSTKAKIKQMIDERKEKINKFMNSSEMAEENKNRVIRDSDTLFSALMRNLQEIQAKLTLNIQKKCRELQEKSEQIIEDLREEIAELEKKQSDLEEVSQTEDHFQLLQTLQELSMTSDIKDWSKVQVYSDLYVQTLRRAMFHIVTTFQVELKTLTTMELNKMRHYKESITFDESTAGSCLVVNDLGKRLRHIKGARHSSLDGSQRFECPMVFGTEGFSSGRHYWEVQVGLRGDWDVGVAEETVDRTENVIVSSKNGFYTIGKTGYEYSADSLPRTVLNLSPVPRKVGIYMDYEVGSVSFYDVDQKLHLHSFTRQKFKGKLFPFFYLYSNAKKSQPLYLVTLYDEAILRALASKSKGQI